MLASKDPKVRLFAQTMITQHTLANTKLAALAEQYGIAYPKRSVQNVNEEPNATTSHSINATRSGTNKAAHPPVGSGMMSPRAYMTNEVRDHQATITMFKDAAKNGSNAAIRTYIGNTLPILEGHLAMAQAYLAGRPMVVPKEPGAENNSSTH